MRSITVRLSLMALSTTVLTTVLVVLLVFWLFRPRTPGEERELYRGTVELLILAWQQEHSLTPAELELDNLWYGYIVDSSGQVLYAQGAGPCSVGSTVAACFGAPAAVPIAGRSVNLDGVSWFEFRQPLRDGLTALVRVQPVLWPELLLEAAVLAASLAGLAFVAGSFIALLLSLITVRPLARRLQRIADASRAVAAGDFTVRINEPVPDAIGNLARNFDMMANTIAHQLQEVRALAQQNSALAVEAERTARSTERATLSRDLHDSVAQHLFSLAMGTADLADLIRRNPTLAAQQAQQLAAIADEAQTELRMVLTQLRPRVLVGRTLGDALLDVTTTWTARQNIPVHVQIQPGLPPFPLVVEDVLVRVVQEGLHNTARHAAAHQVRLQLSTTAQAIHLVLSDDGRGFDPNTHEPGLGIIGMHERVRAIGGALTISSAYAVGTTLAVTIPWITDQGESR